MFLRGIQYIYTYIHACFRYIFYTHTNIHTHTYINTHTMYIHTYTHIHTHMHTYINT